MAKSYHRKWHHKKAIIRHRGAAFQVEINTNGACYRETAPTLDRAKQLIDQKLTELGNEGTAALSLTAGQRIDATKALAHLPDGVTVESSLRLLPRMPRA